MMKKNTAKKYAAKFYAFLAVFFWCLPNKLFDFIQAGVPIVASNLVEVGKIIKKYDIGLFIPDHDPKSIAATIKDGLGDPLRRKAWEEGLARAAEDLCWEKESQVLSEIYAHYA